MILAFTHSTKTRSFIYHLLICVSIAYFLAGEFEIPFIGWWFIVTNIFEFTMFGKDKLRAKMDWSRTPESTFLIMGLLGAFPAILAGRKLFKHKTTKKEFVIPMWILFIIQVILAIAYIEQTSVKGEKMLSFLSL